MNDSRINAVLVFFRRLMEHCFPKRLVRVTNSGPELLKWTDGAWQSIDGLPDKRGMFEQRVLLVPEALSFFQLRRFPADSVTRSALQEAVELDLVRWSPWQDATEYYFWPKQCGESWHVAVWVWQSADLSTSRLGATHVLPEKAWELGCLLQDRHGFIHVRHSDSDAWTYMAAMPDFSEVVIADVSSEADAARFWAGIDPQFSQLPLLSGQSQDPAGPPWENAVGIRIVQPGLPVPEALAMGRQEGVSDWSDPVAWGRPAGLFLGLYILWQLGSGLVLLKQSDEVRDYASNASSVSIEVLDARAEVERANEMIEGFRAQQAQQMRLESILSSLSEELPRDAWLQHMEYRSEGGGWVELTGTSTQSSGLAALFERMPEIEQAMFVNAIRKDRDTGLEPFKIRLKLAGVEQ